MLKSRAWAILAVFLAFLIAACSPFSNGSGTPTPPGNKTASVTALRVAYAQNASMDMLLDGYASAFQSRFPTVRIEKVTVPRSADLEPTIRAGKADVVLVVDRPSALVAAALLDLEAGLRQGNFDLRAIAVADSQWRTGGRILTVPFVAVPSVLVANQKLLEAARLAPPKKGWTWDEFRLYAKQLQESTQLPGFSPASTESLVYQYIQQHSGEPIWSAGADSVEQALRFFISMVEMDRSIPKSEPRSDPYRIRRLPSTDFWSGQAALGLESLGTNMHDKPSFQWQILPLPTLPGKEPFLEVTVFQVGIVNKEVLDQATAFAQFIAGPEGGAVTANSGFLPTYLSPETEKAWTGRQPAGADTLLGSRWMLSPWTAGELTGTQSSRLIAVAELTNQVLSGQLPVSEATARYRQKLGLP